MSKERENYLVRFLIGLHHNYTAGIPKLSKFSKDKALEVLQELQEAKSIYADLYAPLFNIQL